MTHKRIDKNQPEIVKRLRKLGFSVELTYRLGNGFPDFIVGFGGLFTIPVELKSDKGTLTPDEQKLHDRYKGYIIIAYSLDDILLGIHEFYERLYNGFPTEKTKES